MKTDGISAPPGPKGCPYLGSLPHVQSDLLGFLSRTAKEYGDVAQFKVANKQTYLISDPKQIAHVLDADGSDYNKSFQRETMSSAFGEGIFTSDGDEWKRKRLLLQPAFARSRVTTWLDIVISATLEMLDAWRHQPRYSEPFDITRDITALVQTIIVKIIFGRQIENDEKAAVCSSVDTVNKHLKTHILRQSLLGGVLNRLPLPSNRRYDKALGAIHDLIKEVGSSKNADSDSLITLLMKAGLDEKELKDELTAFFFAGQETTAEALSWTLNYLSLNGEIANKVRQESEKVMREGRIKNESLGELRYTKCVIEESMRLMPPVFSLARRVASDDNIGGFAIKRGALAMVSQYVTHRHPGHWESPERFDPDRFGVNGAKKREKYAYFPFGGGSRFCIGKHLAMMEMVSIVAMITHSFHLAPVPRHPVVPETGLTLRPKFGIKMIINGH